MEMKTIIWPTDLSDNSIKAIPHLQSLAEKYDARVLAMYVAVDLCSYFPAYGNYPSKDVVRDFQSWELEQAKAKLESICEAELKACPDVQVRLVQGRPADAILETIEKEKADMVVMTSRGHGAIDKPGTDPGLGAVAKEVLERSPVSVITVNPFQAGRMAVQK